MADPHKIYPLDISEFAPPQRPSVDDEQRPVLPEHPTTEMIDRMRSAAQSCAGWDLGMKRAYAALYAHLIKPKTKPQWRISHTNYAGTAGSETFNVWSDATAAISRLIDGGYTVTVTPYDVLVE